MENRTVLLNLPYMFIVTLLTEYQVCTTERVVAGPCRKRIWWQLCNPTTAKPKVRKKDSARVSHTSPLPTLSLAVLYNDNA